MLKEAQDRFWYSHAQATTRHLSESIASTGDSGYGAMAFHTLINEAVQYGARWNLRETSALSPHIARFLEMCILLGLMESDAPQSELPAKPLSNATSTSEEGNQECHN